MGGGADDKRESLCETLVLLHSLLGVERGLKLVLSERLVIDASRTHHAGTFSEKRTAHVKCR